MTELTTLQWFGVYLVVGACMLVLLRLYVTLVLRPPGDSEFVTEMMAAIRAAQTNGEALAAVLAYREGIRSEALAAASQTSPQVPAWQLEFNLSHCQRVNAAPSDLDVGVNLHRDHIKMIGAFPVYK